SVHLVCRNQARRPMREWSGSFTIHRLRPLPQWLGHAHTFWNFPYPANPAWIAAIGRCVREIRADVIVVRDLPLALPAAIVGQIHGIPVVFDMAENYTAMLQDKTRYTLSIIAVRLVTHPYAVLP